MHWSFYFLAPMLWLLIGAGIYGGVLRYKRYLVRVRRDPLVRWAMKRPRVDHRWAALYVVLWPLGILFILLVDYAEGS